LKTGALGPRPLLKDYAIGEWYAAAGKCDNEEEDSIECHEPMQVKVLDHEGWAMFRCTKGHEQEDDVAWEFVKEPVEFQGRFYWGLKFRGNHGPCASCGRIIYDIPLILWGPQPKVEYELDFCFECVEKIPIQIAQTTGVRTVPGGDNPHE